MRVLITGATGFIGREVCDAARRRGHEVRALTTGSPRDRFHDPDIDVRNADLSKPSAPIPALLDGVDSVVHAAALMDGTHDAMRALTVDGTSRLREAMVAAGIGHGVLLGTFAIYDYEAIDEGSVLDETAPILTSFRGRHPYLETKAAQEQQVDASWTVLRPGIVFGPGRSWHYHLGSARSPRKWVCMSPRARLPIVSVASCADAIVRAAERPETAGRVINLVDDALPTRLEYMNALAEMQASRPSIKTLSWTTLRRMASLAGVADTLLLGKAPLPDLLRSASLHARCKPLEYSNALAKSLLGWTPSRDFVAHLRPSS